MSSSIKIFLATGYVYAQGWSWESQAYYTCDATDDIAEDLIAEKWLQMPLLAAEFGTAVKLVWEKSGLVHREMIYSGEKVRNWLAAYHMPDGTRCIDQVLANVTYYEAMFCGQGVKTVAIAETMEELQHILGSEFSRYDIPG